MTTVGLCAAIPDPAAVCGHSRPSPAERTHPPLSDGGARSAPRKIAAGNNTSRCGVSPAVRTSRAEREVPLLNAGNE